MIDKQTAYGFCEQHHLQGGAQGCPINYGLYYNDQLISVMCFSKPHFDKKKYDWQLTRYCVHGDYMIVGGAERLFKTFRKQYPGSIVTYCDKAKFDGQVYKKLGFELLVEHKPRYVWVKGTQVLVRHLAKKQNIKKVFPDADMSKTEVQLMSEMGYVQVFDAGQTTWVIN
jgi:hypothetical protein